MNPSLKQKDHAANRKDDAYWKVLTAAMELDVKKGHLKWSMSELSRKSRITRSLIYYYFGQSKMAILNEAIKLIGDEFTGLSPERVEMWQRGELLESMQRTRDIYEKSPYISIFILENRNKDSEIGRLLRDKEFEFQTKIRKFYPHFDDDMVQSLFAVYWGLSFAPGLTTKAIENIIQIIKKNFFKG